VARKLAVLLETRQPPLSLAIPQSRFTLVIKIDLPCF
jgi:hypothetical protein